MNWLLSLEVALELLVLFTLGYLSTTIQWQYRPFEAGVVVGAILWQIASHISHHLLLKPHVSSLMQSCSNCTELNLPDIEFCAKCGRAMK